MLLATDKLPVLKKPALEFDQQYLVLQTDISCVALSVRLFRIQAAGIIVSCTLMRQHSTTRLGISQKRNAPPATVSSVRALNFERHYLKNKKV